MLRRLLLMAMLVAVLFWPAASSGQTDDPVPIRVGDRWSYEVRDGATGDIRHEVTVVVVDITDKEISTRVNHRDKPIPQAMIFDRQWGLVDNSVWKYQPKSNISIKTPLHVGKEWRWETNARNTKTGDAYRSSGVAKVTGQEKITIKAGTFDTYRIQADLQQVNSKDQTKTARVTHVFWYAPALNRWAKKTYEVRFEGRLRDSTLEELTEYSRKP